MGSSESTGRSNGREEEEEDRQPENSSSGGGGRGGGGGMGAGTVAAIAAGTVVAAWGISREEEEEEEDRQPGAGTVAAIAGTVVAAWGISRMISGGTDSENEEKDEVMKIKAHGKVPSLPNTSSFQYESICSPPPSGKFKMNTDGACPHKTKGPDGVERGPSGYAGILRNHHGKWVGGFRGFLGVTDSLTAELHGIHEGLKFLDRRCYSGSILENDNEEAVKWIKPHEPGTVEWNRRQNPGKSPIILNCWEIIMESRDLANKNKITICHINEKYNRCADALADMAVRKEEKYVEIKNLPYEIKHLVDQESDLVKTHGYASPSIYNLDAGTK